MAQNGCKKAVLQEHGDILRIIDPQADSSHVLNSWMHNRDISYDETEPLQVQGSHRNHAGHAVSN